MRKKDWEEQQPKIKTEGLSPIWIYNYYLENLHLSPFKIVLSYLDFEAAFSKFMLERKLEENLNINIVFTKVLFSSGRSYYLHSEYIFTKVIKFFNEKTNWNES